MIHNGKEHEKEYIRICIAESLCCTAEINTANQLPFNKIKKKKKVNGQFSGRQWLCRFTWIHSEVIRPLPQFQLPSPSLPSPPRVTEQWVDPRVWEKSGLYDQQPWRRPKTQLNLSAELVPWPLSSMPLLFGKAPLVLLRKCNHLYADSFPIVLTLLQDKIISWTLAESWYNFLKKLL